MKERNFYDLPVHQPLTSYTFTVFDLETTGFLPEVGDAVVSFGAVKWTGLNWQEQEHFYELVKPVIKVPKNIFQLTGIKKSDIKHGIPFVQAFGKFLEFSKGTILVAHPASFDVNFLKATASRWELPDFHPLYIDSYTLARFLHPDADNRLDHLIDCYGVKQHERHHALNDAIMTGEVFLQMIEKLNEKDILTLSHLQKALQEIKPPAMPYKSFDA
ncbi:3'-5' exonuclease [Bacillus marinisedimentorum]|uniref:3'-5' exonuclease n=1 Tax=Bacillus marinisedimentorum TaxID=1821260 RepID=UPI0012FF8C2B|nr:exonuclease domain-containing protein [Bacillus marinisedimentorum]